MSAPIIGVRNLGKSYRIRRQGSPRYASLRDSVSSFWKPGPRDAHQAFEEFWALKEVSFDVSAGERVGIIGRNGAGKSTLLKILSQISEPTTGRVTLAGRVSSLLEVGTGFHPELTGRENIFLNGAILGMKRREIARKFDEIVAFAEVERFLDTPVKHYSSGMYVRLAFAVAAHLEPDVLVVDEVLAVGDVEFQKKCLGKMTEVSRDGRTVLFVSHNMGAISALCTKGVVLESGRVAFEGAVGDALSCYAQSTGRLPQQGKPADGPSVLQVSVNNDAALRGDLRIAVEFDSPTELSAPSLGVVIHASNGNPVFGFNTTMDSSFQARPARSGSITLSIDDAPLHSGVYRVSIWLGDGEKNHVSIPDATSFAFEAPHPVPAGVSIDIIGSTRVAGRFTLS